MSFCTVTDGKYLKVRGPQLVVLDDSGNELATYDAAEFERIERVPFPKFVVSLHNTRLADRSFEFLPRNGWNQLQKELLTHGWTGNLDFFGPGMTFPD